MFDDNIVKDSCSAEQAHSIGKLQYKTGVAKLFDPKAEFVIAWPLEGRMQCDLRDKQQPMLLHCCPQSETWCLIKMWKLFGRPD